MRDLVHDVRHAARALLVRPGYSLAALLTLALGIGATTAVFSALHGFLLRPVPYPAGDRLVNVCAGIPQSGGLQLGLWDTARTPTRWTSCASRRPPSRRSRWRRRWAGPSAKRRGARAATASSCS